MKVTKRLLARVGRGLLLMLVVTTGTIFLMRHAPGYFTDSAEMDSRFSETARARIAAEQAAEGSTIEVLAGTVKGWLHGDFGRSRHYDLPVRDLLAPRLRTTGTLLLESILAGWFVASCAALLSGSGLRALLVGLPFTVLLAVPAGALATACVVSDHGGPVLALTLVIAARDYKFLVHILKEARRAPYLLQARAQGLGATRLLLAHVLPASTAQLRALATMSVVTALSALVPIEVLFDRPGVGQMAWSAALNRDLPVLLVVTLLMSATVVAATSLSEPDQLPQRLVELA